MVNKVATRTSELIYLLWDNADSELFAREIGAREF
jgi:hypothetical protein